MTVLHSTVKVEWHRARFALLCAGSLLARDDAVVIPCDHPASPFAQSGPAIVVPRIRSLGIESVRPDLAGEDLAGEGTNSPHQHQPASLEGDAGQHQAPPAKMGAKQHQYRPVSTGGDGQHQH
jgi:hypothetical protein